MILSWLLNWNVELIESNNKIAHLCFVFEKELNVSLLKDEQMKINYIDAWMRKCNQTKPYYKKVTMILKLRSIDPAIRWNFQWQYCFIDDCVNNPPAIIIYHKNKIIKKYSKTIFLLKFLFAVYKLYWTPTSWNKVFTCFKTMVYLI